MSRPKKPMREDNLFRIASMTKMFAGASIMMLIDESKVSLDDPVTNTMNSQIFQESAPHQLELISRRRLLRRAIVSAACLPLLGDVPVLAGANQ